MNQNVHLTKWQQGDRFSASHLNQAWEAIEKMNREMNTHGAQGSPISRMYPAKVSGIVEDQTGVYDIVLIKGIAVRDFSGDLTEGHIGEEERIHRGWLMSDIGKSGHSLAVDDYVMACALNSRSNYSSNLLLIPLGGRDFFVARVASSSRDGSNWRWTYQIDEMQKTGVGWGNWAVRTNGRTGSCFNLIENNNGASGVLGNGVDTANLPAGFEPQPIPNGTLIQVWTESTGEGAEYWCQVTTVPDGECE